MDDILNPQSIVHIPLARDMGSVRTAHAYARKVGRDKTAVLWTKMHCNVCPIARDTEPSIWTNSPAIANQSGAAMIVRKV